MARAPGAYLSMGHSGLLAGAGSSPAAAPRGWCSPASTQACPDESRRTCSAPGRSGPMLAQDLSAILFLSQGLPRPHPTLQLPRREPSGDQEGLWRTSGKTPAVGSSVQPWPCCHPRCPNPSRPVLSNGSRCCQPLVRHTTAALAPRSPDPTPATPPHRSALRILSLLPRFRSDSSS